MSDIVLLTKIAYDFALAATVVFALAFGGWSERLGGTIALLASGASGLVWPIAHQFQFLPRYGNIAVDVATLAAFDAVMVRSRAFWPMWATGIQFLTIAFDAAIIAEPAQAIAYRMIQGKMAYPILLSIVFGSLRARHLRARTR